MVAKINRGASLYGAIIYNQQKVNDNTARIIYGNRMIANVSGNTERVMQQTLWAFDNYLLANKNTEKPVLHISLNPSLDDRLTDLQFTELAREYMHFFFNDTATTEIYTACYTLSLHDALPFFF